MVCAGGGALGEIEEALDAGCGREREGAAFFEADGRLQEVRAHGGRDVENGGDACGSRPVAWHKAVRGDEGVAGAEAGAREAEDRRAGVGVERVVHC